MADDTTTGNDTTGGASTGTTGARKAGAFDIRNFIGMLIGIFGVVLLLASIFDSEADIAKADGVRVNLWAGAGMVLTALVFFAWARLRPVVVPEDTP
ncbi:hypothetical protein [Nocardioides aurantiacus]|uniref:hypothetical protein n=1 Tax=Nocardioides aurantiacus TaxID=86796 RepID=UPI00403F3B9C